MIAPQTRAQIAAQLQKYAATLPGMKQAPSKPPEALNDFPYVLTFYQKGENTSGEPAGQLKTLGTFVTQIHVARKDVAMDYLEAMPYGDLFAVKLAENSTLGGLVDTVVWPVLDTFGYMEYAGVATIGWSFAIQVKFKTDVTVS